MTESTEDVTEDIVEESLETEEVVTDELTLLKERADKMHIKYHPSIGLDKLKEKVNAILAPVKEAEPEVNTEEPREETAGERQVRLRKEATRLIRVRVTCMDPNKKGWPGEIFTISNAVVGTVRKFIPFNVEYHVPFIILKHMKKKKRQEFREVKTRNGMKIKRGFLVPAFSIEELPPLTEEELKELARKQALNRSID